LRCAHEVALCAAMRLPVASFVALALFASTAKADEHALYSLDLSGARYGLVHAAVSGDHRLVVDAPDVAPSLVTLIDGFVQGKAVKRDVRLTSGAVVRKAEGARLVAVKLPALGSGGSADIQLAFTVPAITTQPLLTAKDAPAQPASTRITAFRVDVSGMQALEAPKLDAITVTQKPDGSATTGDVAFEVAAGGAPPFVAWSKASAAKPAPRAFRVEYVGADGVAILKVRLDRCLPSRVAASGRTDRAPARAWKARPSPGCAPAQRGLRVKRGGARPNRSWYVARAAFSTCVVSSSRAFASERS
jgi:hypothetical protein